MESELERGGWLSGLSQRHQRRAAIGPYVRVSGTLIAGLTYTDTVPGGKTYYYVATAVDSAGNESVHSNEASAVVP